MIWNAVFVLLLLSVYNLSPTTKTLVKVFYAMLIKLYAKYSWWKNLDQYDIHMSIPYKNGPNAL